VSVVLEADGLGRSFGREEVLKAASFRAVAGRITALLGRNGSGKTTMLRIASGRLRADYGRVLYRGRYRARPRLSRLAREGLMFNPQGTLLTPHFRIREHLDAVRDVVAREAPEAIEATTRVVARMRLDECLERRPPGLSGGEKQRASLAMALLRRPSCLLHDEPFAGISPADRGLVAEGLTGLRDLGAAIVVTGHDVEDLFAVADEVIWVVAGTSHWLGTPEEARVHAQFGREYLGPRGVSLGDGA